MSRASLEGHGSDDEVLLTSGTALELHPFDLPVGLISIPDGLLGLKQEWIITELYPPNNNKLRTQEEEQSRGSGMPKPFNRAITEVHLCPGSLQVKGTWF